MKLLTYHMGETLKLGVLTDEGVVDVAAAAAGLSVDVPTTPGAFYKIGSDALEGFEALLAGNTSPYTHPESQYPLGPAVPNPQKVLCVGLNYMSHANESKMDAPQNPILFGKFNNALAASGDDIPMHTNWKTVDYEAELVVVIGSVARNVTEADALNYVLGYCNGNDISERDLQFLTAQWLLGKSPDKFMPIGPYMVTADEAGDVTNMPIKGWFNGELRQDSNTRHMIFSVAQIIAFASQHMTLYPGDVISTGTPEGVILGMEEKHYMQPGDEYVVEVGGLGRLTNKMIAAKAS